MTVGLITSAAYINPEMVAEFGALPPAFLPVGNSRLFVHQARVLKPLADRIFITLPQSFVPSDSDLALLAALQICIVKIPDGLRLAESAMLALISILGADEPVTILHGDTLIIDLQEFADDGFSIHSDGHPYPWAIVSINEAGFQIDETLPGAFSEFTPNGGIVSGLFRFKSSLALLKALARSNGNFIEALRIYSSTSKTFLPSLNFGKWLDFGHLNTYYNSRRTVTTERAFNMLKISEDVVTKSSLDTNKMIAEAHWFQAIPDNLKLYTPKFLGCGENGDQNTFNYRLEYEYLCPLNDLYVFGLLPKQTWRDIFRSCKVYMDAAKSVTPDFIPSVDIHALYHDKPQTRLRDFQTTSSLDMSLNWTVNGSLLPSPVEIIEQMFEVISAFPAVDGIMHGDFCFSNILFDFRKNRIKLIDPRGYVDGKAPSIYGDIRYDLAKLHHSACGNYDLIVAGYHKVSMPKSNVLEFFVPKSDLHADIEELFNSTLITGDVDTLVTAAISVELFLSMIALHYDRPERQLGFLANGLLLYKRYFGQRP